MVFLILDFKPTVRPFIAVKEKDSRVQWVLFGRFDGFYFYFNATILELGICFARLQKIMTRTLKRSEHSVSLDSQWFNAQLILYSSMNVHECSWSNSTIHSSRTFASYLLVLIQIS